MIRPFIHWLMGCRWYSHGLDNLGRRCKVCGRTQQRNTSRQAWRDTGRWG